MPRREQPVHAETDRFAREMEPVYASLSFNIRKNLSNGQGVTDAVDNAVEKVGYAAILRKKIPDMQVRLIGDGSGVVKIADPIARRNWFLNKHWPGEDLTLSQNINKIARMADIKSSLRRGLRDKRAWTATAQGLFKENLQTADLATHITDLESSAKRVIAGDKAAMKQYRRNLKKSMRAVSKLQKNGAPTGRLKKAYANVVTQTQTFSTAAINKSMDNLIKAKSHYNATRLARTEGSKAFIQGTYERVLDDDQVIGMGYDLSDRHIIVDICDFHCGADLYNLGPGQYPLTQLPPYPFHPHCACVPYNVYVGDVKPLDKKAGAKFLKKEPIKNQKAMLGIQGQKELHRGKGTNWGSNLRNYNGHRSIHTLYKATKTKEAG